MLDVGAADCQVVEKVIEYRIEAASNPGYNRAMRISVHWLVSPQ